MKKIIFIMPLMAISLLANCKETKQPTNQFFVTFDANGGKVLSENPLIVEGGKYIKAPVLEERPGYNKDDVVWRDEDGNPFNFTTTNITNNTVLCADWGEIKTYHVTFYLNGQEYKKEDVEYNHKPHRLETPSVKFDNWYTDNTYSTPFDFDKELTGEECNINIYGRDRDEYSITIKGQHIEEQKLTFLERKHEAIFTQINVDEDYVLTNEIEVEPANAVVAHLVDENTLKITPQLDSHCTITLKPKFVQTFYDISANGTNLKFFKDREMKLPLEETQAIKGSDLVFYMLAEQPDPYSNSEGYMPPTDLSISIGGGEKFGIAEITPVEGEYHNIESMVFISKEHIEGDIKITGAAVQAEYYQITCPYLFGLKQPEIQTTFHKYSEPAEFEFIADEDAQYDDDLLTAENIFVNFTGSDDGWISPADPEFEEYGNFAIKSDENDKHYILTINADVVQSDANVIRIIARTQKYPTLERLTWDEINYASEKGFAPSLLSIGDTKKINLENRGAHTVRLIGFNHDELADGSGKAGITFDFANVYDGYRTAWNEGSLSVANYNYPTSILAKNIEGNNVYGILPNDLKNVLKKVKKSYDYHSSSGWVNDRTFDTKLFPLSLTELNYSSTDPSPSPIDKPYAFYKNGGIRHKKDRTSNSRKYWTRSPLKSSGANSYTINEGGAPEAKACIVSGPSLPWYVAPGFCV